MVSTLGLWLLLIAQVRPCSFKWLNALKLRSDKAGDRSVTSSGQVEKKKSEIQARLESLQAQRLEIERDVKYFKQAMADIRGKKPILAKLIPQAPGRGEGNGLSMPNKEGSLELAGATLQMLELQKKAVDELVKKSKEEIRKLNKL